MKTGTIAWAMGSAILIAMGSLGAVACSSGGSGTPNGGTGTAGNNGGTDSGHDGTATSGNNGNATSGNTGGDANGGNNGGDDGGNGSGGDGGTADCGSTPILHPVDAGLGPYCPFSAAGDAGNLTCTQGQHCCEPSAAAGTPSTCQTDCSAQPDGGTDWACQGTANCTGGDVCCAIASSAAQDPGCSYHFLHGFKGTVCAASCGAGQIQVCENTSGECTTGTCQTAKGKGGSFGLCL